MVLILGIDRFMSECRALTNIVGNGVATVVVVRAGRANSTASACARSSGIRSMRPTCVSRSRPSDCGERRRLARGQLRYCVRSFISGEPLIEHGPSGRPDLHFSGSCSGWRFPCPIFPLSHHQALARRASRSPAALFAADAERREGLDHAGGDRAALRAASDRHRQE